MLVSLLTSAPREDNRVESRAAMSNHDQAHDVALYGDTVPWLVMICLLGNFRLLVGGQSIPTRAGGKSEALLSLLAIHYNRRVSREQILQSLWPESEPALARNSLHNLVHHLNKLLGPALHGAGPVLQADGYYRLNSEAGVGVDVAYFDRLVEAGDRQAHAGDLRATFHSYDRAVQLYREDLQFAGDAQTIMERERLRACYLMLLARLAEYHYEKRAYSAALTYLWRLLARDPYREDAHRLVMRCYVQRGERATALHHYQVCTDLLRSDFGAPPEAATVALFNQIRLDPAQI
jgi:DNA-binding SARP family transcriptional activator